ncbi:MAG: peptide deformylase [Actinobacteria bacterium]|nr:peptide deformylase [Actinomycetota bacterium]
MTPLEIRLFGDPVLRATAPEVTEFDERLTTFADDLLATMRAANGVGLAANQVGVLKRLFAWELVDLGHGWLVNPQVVESSLEVQVGDEGCLSFPGLFYPTERPVRVRMRWQDLHGEEQVTEAAELQARVFLHELDHLNGVLFIDHLARHDYKDAMRRIRRGELLEAPIDEPSSAQL